MPETPDWTIVFSGPLAQRAGLLSALQRAGIAREPSPGTRGHSYGLPDDPTLGWIAVRHEDVNEVVDLVKRGDWTLRLHWPTPDCRACHGTGRVNHGTTGAAACLHCGGAGRTNKPVPSAEQQMAEMIERLTERISVLEGNR